MGDLTENFSRHEFACKGCGKVEGCIGGMDTIDFELVTLLQRFRDFIEKRITVNSGCRCPAWNKHVGGGENSQHLLSRAADIVVEDVPPNIVQEWFEQEGVQGLGKYVDFTHVDTRSGPRARWSG